MAYAQEKYTRAHILLIEEGGDYADYFSQGTNEDGEPSAWFLTNSSDEAAAQALLDAKVAELTEIGIEESNGDVLVILMVIHLFTLLTTLTVSSIVHGS